jgi:hypothetical protein
MAGSTDAGPDDAGAQQASHAPVPTAAQLETDDFGLPIRRYITPTKDATQLKTDAGPNGATGHSQKREEMTRASKSDSPSPSPSPELKDQESSSTSTGPDDARGTETESKIDSDSDADDAPFVDAQSAAPAASADASPSKLEALTPTSQTPRTEQQPKADEENNDSPISEQADGLEKASAAGTQTPKPESEEPGTDTTKDAKNHPLPKEDKQQDASTPARLEKAGKPPTISHSRDVSAASIGSGTHPNLSEFSHQQLSTQQEDKKENEDGGWQTMPAFAPYDLYDDDNRLIAREHNDEEDDESYGYSGLGGAGKGYTRVLMDEDAESATSMDDHTQYLFKDIKTGTGVADEEGRDAVGQMEATKDLLTEGQRIAYVGVVRLEIANMVKDAEALEITKKSKKMVNMSAESEKMWGQKMMIRLYSHMDISEAEQVMIEQLAEHGVVPKDLTPALHANSRVHNPMAEDPTSASNSIRSASASPAPSYPDDEKPAEMPPPYESIDHSEVPDAQTPSQLPTTEKIDIDLRWTVLCDLFLILIADSIYDARSRVLLERVAGSLEIPWIDICKFEKRVTDALEMQQAAEKENWNEDEHMESRRKLAQKRRYMMMGLATVGGGLVIGLSAGLLAPVIGAGLAAGFTTIGVTGTSSFLAGAGGAAIITSSAAASGSFIGGRAANRRTGAVKTFEYRPLHNNKRVNLIVTVSGWLTGKVDDVRLPYSTVDPIMGDIYSVLWEPEMLRSMGDTINILATEVRCNQCLSVDPDLGRMLTVNR